MFQAILSIFTFLRFRSYLMRGFIPFVLVLFYWQAFATHIKAGDISAQRDANNSSRYTFTLTVYFDSDRITTGNQNNLVPVNTADLDFGDGSLGQRVSLSSLTNIGNGVTVGVYVFTHTFLTQGTYVVSYTDFNRIGGILNMDNSVSTSLYLDLQLRVDPFLGRNSTPTLLVPPIDIANKGQIYTHNPGAFDADGDSLSFELIPPKKLANLNVDNYVSPADPKFNGVSTSGDPATLTINPRTGQITWNTPGQSGTAQSPAFYNIAIRVNEYRGGRLIGYVVRDMQIEVRESQNRAPLVQMPKDTCLVSGVLHSRQVRVSDPDGHSLFVERYGQPFNLGPGASVVGPVLPAPSPSLYTINWNPTCALVRREPYQLLVKASDNVAQSIRLADIKAWNVKLLAPAPTWKNIERLPNNTLSLSWEYYPSTCNRTSGNIRIFRSVCDSNFVYDPCVSPSSVPNRNFQLIATLPITDSTFIDNLSDIGFSQGVIYNYALFVDFPSPGFGNSLPSKVFKFSTEFSTPVITNIEVLSNTSLRVNWKAPKTIQGATAPFTYVIERGLNTTDFQQVGVYNSLNSPVDTFFIDNSVSTSDTRYYYRVTLSAAGINALTSPNSSSTLLRATPGNQQALLTFESFASTFINKTLIINRTVNTVIDSVGASSKTYIARDLINCDTVAFVVQPVSRFCSLGFDPVYLNTSNLVKVLPRDTNRIVPEPRANNPYCEKLDCSSPSGSFTDTITWNPAGNSDCSQSISYNLFFSETNGGVFSKIASTTLTSYIHQKQESFVGCYYLTVVRDGVESAPGKVFCLDNTCGCYELPNVITPNQDGKNDLLRPLPTPVNVKSVDFTLFNRWGKVIFNKKNDIFLNWDANEVDAGHYFYEADVVFFGLNNPSKKIKGWLQIVK